ncbi:MULTISPECIES: aldehyde dehydrogenase family protein [unclassified Achromobacter]|uniref:aldehyde dehydrogenase family protein n=1 Tax=unclassified Achromobacter TaxID=2626865 RepID=UPI000B516669|nr:MULTISPECIES: aldehyde dehydrogenase family protein [unclassified Achromobacter]OWT67960.1 aldehyde dehydrogenase [Achromobacter sp. HZ28]OWT81018.1 aldehyde dehydrogenase [Achromobacter sp. HZ34]
MDAQQKLGNCQLLIDGQWVDGDRQLPVLNKYTQATCATYHLPTQAQVNAAVASAQAAFQGQTLTPYDRGVILDRAAAILHRRTEDLIQALIEEVGFTRSDAQGEISRCIQTFRLSAEEARNLTGEMVPVAGAPAQAGRLGFTLRVPLGVVCAITPFNAPLNTVAHKVAPGLAAGNAVVLKPSAHTPTAAVIMAKALIEAGLPSGLLAVLHGGAEVAQWLLENQDIHFYAFTGSTEVGRHIQRSAGLRRTQMELGSIAFTILAEDADLDRALPKVINAAYRKAGQVCTSVQLLLVHRSIQRQVEERLAAAVSTLRYGDPAHADTIVGPVISEGAAERIDAWIQEAVSRGARLLAGGRRQGAVVPPTLLTDLSSDMCLSCREVFGPVMSIEPFDTLDGAISRVNATPFGLATGLFTNRIDQALDAARRLQVGGVHINETSSSRVDVMPYGGSKASGFGREGPHYAVREMSEERMVTVVA